MKYNKLKEVFEKDFPGINNIVFLEVTNKEYPNLMIIVGGTIKFWVHVIDEKNTDPQPIKVHENIKLFRELGFITGYITNDDFRMRDDNDCKVYKFNYVMKGNILKWLGDDSPATKMPETGNEQQITIMKL